MEFLLARHFKRVGRTRVDWIVLHSAEVGETLGSAEALMRACATTDRVASWHFAVDADSITQSVAEEDVAFHAPGANARGIGIELCGRARQTAAEWDDEYSRSTIARAAGLTAALCRRWKIPIAYVPADGLLRGVRGITTHAETTKAFRRSSHTDPGANWPMGRFLDLVRTYSTQIA